ncbi:MAG: hypothetical protein HN356_11475 [Calditrichaeota bacterium]|jgi:hypothetical protein|nr:hypothetical protein [Calditrichota bacterium]MBT7615711.1 hypothetical protein [Calditrichota bacterium]MBT7789235.1 hypothetical protein [Calditrichota bacterium]
MKTFQIIGFAVLLALILPGTGIAVNIFVWQCDNNLPFEDPVFDEELTAFSAITQTLEELDIEYDDHWNLPDNINDYDVLIAPMGFFCNT